MIALPVTLFIADDHEIVIDGLKLLIQDNDRYKIVGSCTDGQLALEQIIKLKPHIAILDLRMPGLTGLQIILKLRNDLQTKFIVLSMHNDPHYILDVKNTGGHGYLLKNTGKEILYRCLAKVADGGKFFPEEIITNNVSPEKLTPREIEILKLVLNEKTTQQISVELNLSHFTVETHRKNIWRKTNTKTLVGLIKYAIENKIEFQ